MARSTRRRVLATGSAVLAGGISLTSGPVAPILANQTNETGGRDSHELPVERGWPMYRGGPGHAGAATWTSGPDGPPDLAWTYEPTWHDDVELAEPAVLDGRVYVAEAGLEEDEYGTVEAGRVAALAACDGTVQWTYELDCAGFTTTPAVQDDTVYVGDIGGTVHALGSETGSVQWTRELDAGSALSPVTPVGDVLYVSGTATYALDATDGTTNWRSDAMRSPSVAGDIVVGYDRRDGTPHVVAADASTGEELWATATDGGSAGGYGTPPAVRGGVTLGQDGGPDSVHAVATADGTRLWNDAGDGGVRPVLDRDRAYGAYNFGPPVHAHEAESGEETWTTDRFEATGQTLAGDVLYVARGMDGFGEQSFEALDPTDGSEFWRTDHAVGAFAIADGAVFATNDDGTLRALR